MWAWVAYMVPHRMTWGFAYDFPVAMVIGITTVLAWLISKEDKKVPWHGISVLMLMFILWFGLTTVFALNPEEAFQKWIDFNKIILMTFVTMVLMKSERRLDALIWVTTLSIGFFSIKGGLFTLRTGGQSLVWGPPSGTLADNNAMAMGTLMIVPLFWYLARIATNRWIRYAIIASIGLSLFSAMGSYSRGAIVAMVAIVLFTWWNSKRKLMFGVMGLVAIIGFTPFIPGKWVDRMETIRSYEEDSSAVGRIEMWVFAINVALDRPFVGGGYGVFSKPELYDKYGPGATVRNVHSVYFEALGTQGFVGLAIFLMLGAAGFRTGSWVLKTTKGIPELEKQRLLAKMLQTAIIAYAVAGAFQNLSTLDLYYNLLAMMLMCKLVTMQKLSELGIQGIAPTGPTAAFRRPALAGYLSGPSAPQPAGSGFRR